MQEKQRIHDEHELEAEAEAVVAASLDMTNLSAFLPADSNKMPPG